MEQKTTQARRFRWSASAQAWTWSAVVASFVICLSIGWMNHRQEETLRRYRRLLTDLREARLDLARGYLHLSLANDSRSPFSREEVLALLDQSVAALNEVRDQIFAGATMRSQDAALVDLFRAKTRAFGLQLSAYSVAEPAVRHERELSLRLSFQELEQLVQRMDDLGQSSLNALADRLRAHYAALLTSSAALLVFLCVGIYRVGRRQEAAARALRANQERLQASEARYRALFDEASEGITVMGTDGSGLQVNGAFARLHGYGSPAEMASVRLGDLLTPQAAELAPERLRRAASGEPCSFEVEHYRKDRSVFTLCVTATRLELSGLPYLLSFYRDITDLKAGEEAIRQRLELQDQLAKIVATVPGVIYSFELNPDGKMRMPFCTPAMEDYWGVQPSVLRDDFSPAFARIHAEDVRRVRESIGESARRLTPWRESFRVRHPRKGELWLEGHSVPRREPDGSVLWYGFVQDVTERKQVEASRRESEERLKLFIEHAPAALAMFDSDMRYLAASQRWMKDYHLEGRSITGLSHYEVFPQIPDSWRAAHRRGLAGNVIRSEEDRLERADGRVQWLRWEVHPWRKADGTVGGIVIFTEDVTERKQALLALKESEERFRAMVETTFDWVWEVDAGGRYTYVSPKVRELLGYEPEEVIGRTPFDLMPEAEARRVGALFFEIAAKRQPFSVLENVNQHKDGRLVILETSGIPVFTPDGQFAGYRGMDRDITARKQAEAALRRSETHLRTLVNTLPDLVWLKDPQGKYLACNARFERFFGAAEAEIVGKTDYDFMDRAVADSFRANDAAAVAAGGPRINEEDVTYASDGHRETLETIKTPMFDASGSLVGVLGISRDVTERKQAEEALRQSESRRALALDAAQAGTWEWELSTGRNTWSDELWRLYGLAANSCEASHEAWLATVAPEDREHVDRQLKEVVEQGNALSLEWRVNNTDDGPRWLMSRGRPLRDAAGRVTRYVGVVMDITARKRAVLALEAEAACLAAVLEAQRAIASSDLEYADLLQLILARMSRLAGADGASLEMADGDEMVYETATGLAAPFIGLRIKAARSLSGLCLASGELMRSDDVASDPRVDLEACQRIGLRSMLLIPLRYAEHDFGVLKLMASRTSAFAGDVERSLRLMAEFLGATISRKRTEMRLREREARLLTLGDNIPGGAIYQLHMSADGLSRYTYVSAGVERIFGIPAASILADPAPYWELIVEEDRAALDEAKARSLRELTLFDREFRQRTVAGELKWIHAISRPRRLADGSTVWDGVIMDITERKRVEAERASLEGQLRQAQKLESVGRLAGGVAHDFNNLLMSIMGHAELCREELEADHPACADLDGIIDAAQRSAGITRQLLAFARQQTVAPVVLNVNDHVANTLKLLRRLIGENIELDWQPKAQRAFVRLDPSQLDQILANLAVNARDAIAGVGQITVETQDAVFEANARPLQEGAEPGAYVMLAVSDTGCGMDSQTLEHVFEPFFTTKPIGQGTGLGLATVYGIVKQNNGLIDVQSEPGKGTTFRIYLRRHEEPAQTGPALTAPAERGGSETVLLVEDDGVVRKITDRHLKAFGYHVLAAASPAEALRLIADHAGPVHLVITDVVMPGMGGPELAAKLAEAYPHIKCLLISGYPEGHVSSHGTLPEGFHFLAKPFSGGALANKVREVLGSP